MKRRLEIARGLLHHPKVLFLDEPTIGLDPQTRRHIWQYLMKLRQQEGVTMFMTTHYMEEAEHCDRIAVIDHGKIVALDTPEHLKKLVGGDIITVRTSDNERAAAALKAAKGVDTRPGPDGQLIVETPNGDRFIPVLIEVLVKDDPPIAVESISLSRPTLEDVFIKVTGHAIRASEADATQPLRQMARMWTGSASDETQFQGRLHDLVSRRDPVQPRPDAHHRGARAADALSLRVRHRPRLGDVRLAGGRASTSGSSCSPARSR